MYGALSLAQDVKDGIFAVLTAFIGQTVEVPNSIRIDFTSRRSSNASSTDV
jgi:hypothetical protein